MDTPKTLYCKKCRRERHEDQCDEKYGKLLCVECGSVVEEVCEWCLGTGEITEDGWNDDAKAYERGTESRKCPCQLPDNEDEERHER